MKKFIELEARSKLNNETLNIYFDELQLFSDIACLGMQKGY